MSTNLNQVKKSNVGVSSIVFMIFCICAAGAYGIEAMIPAAGPGLTLVLLMVVPFIWGLPMALATVELGSARPVEGGFYKWIQEALGEFWGFQAGWWKTLANYLDSTVYIILAGGYVGYITGMSDLSRYLFQAGIIAVIVIINLRGVKESGRLSTIFGVAILLMFLLVTVVGFLNVKYNPFEPFIPESQDLLTSVGGGIALCIWLYSGYEAMSAISGEVENPKVIPKATLIAVPMIAATYILPTAAGLSSVGNWESWQEGIAEGTVGFGTVLTQFLGNNIWGVLFGIVAVMSACSIYNTWMTAGTRILFTLSADHLGPQFINKVNKRGVPFVPVLIMAFTNLVLCSFDFSVVLVIEVLLIIGTQVLLFLTMIVMRFKKPDMPRPLRIPGHKIFINVFFSIPIFVGLIAYLLNGTDYFIGGVIGLVTGPIAYLFFKKKYGGLHKTDPELYPLNEKTKLAPKDTYRMAILFLVLTIVSVIGAFFLPWYEGSWGPEYYLETYGADIFKIMIQCIWGIAAVSGLLTIILYFRAKKTEK